MKAKAYIPKEECVVEKSKFHDRIEAMEYAIAHYARVQWFRLNKERPIEQDTVFGCGVVWDYQNHKPKQKNAQQLAEAKKAEQILFQFLRSIEVLKK